MTREEVQQLMMTMQAFFPQWKVDNPTFTINAWQLILDEYDPSFIKAGLKQYIKTSGNAFAPSLPQLLASAQQIIEVEDTSSLNESEAWAMVRKAIGRATYYAEEEFNKFPPEVQKAVGSPSNLRALAQADNFNDSVESSNFKRVYRQVSDVAQVKSKMALTTRVQEAIESHE